MAEGGKDKHTHFFDPFLATLAAAFEGMYVENLSVKALAKTIFDEPWAKKRSLRGVVRALESIFWKTVFTGLDLPCKFDACFEPDSLAFCAIKSNDIETLKKYYSDPDASTEIIFNSIRGLTPLVYACTRFEEDFQKGASGEESRRLRYQIVQYLLSRGSNINSCAEVMSSNVIGFGNVSALYLAVKAKNIPLIRLLLKHGADVNIRTVPYKLTAIHQAAFKDLPDICAQLINAGADINCQDVDGNTPLIIACAYGRSTAAKLLVSERADYKLVNVRKITALHAAVYRGDKEVIKLLLRAGADINARTAEGYTPLDYSIFMIKTHLQGMLVAAKAVASECILVDETDRPLHFYLPPSYGGQSPLHVTAKQNYFEDVKYFVEQGADVNAVDALGEGPLFSAVRCGSTQLVEYLLKANAKVNALNNVGMTPLHIVTFNGVEQVARLLIKYGAIVDDSVHKFKPFLVTTAEMKLYEPVFGNLKERKAKVAEVLIQNGAFIDQKYEKYTPMGHAVKDGNSHVAIVIQNHLQIFRYIEVNNMEGLRCLLEAGEVILDCRSVSRGTPLKDAVVRNNVTAVSILIEYGADLHYGPILGITPLHYAAKADFRDVAFTLVSSGAAFDARTKDGRTPLDLCLHSNSDGCDTAILLRFVEEVFLQGGDPTLKRASNELQFLIAGARNAKGQSVEDVRLAMEAEEAKADEAAPME